MHKVETINEFLARGGSITKCPAETRETKAKSDVVRSTRPVEAPTPLSLEEYSLMYGEPKSPSKRKKAASKSKIDFSALPDFIREKYLKEAVNGENKEGEEDEED
jgi:hypothetical protein